MSALERKTRYAMGSFARIEAGPEMQGPSAGAPPSPSNWRQRRKPLVMAGLVMAARWTVILAVVGGALVIGAGLSGR